MRVCFFYQTFEQDGKPVSLDPMLNGSGVTDIIVASVHFGTEKDGQPYIHLNNDYPGSKGFESVWDSLRTVADAVIKVSVLVGGAGGGFATLFANFEACYDLLKDFLKNHPEITGINLDVEEAVKLEDITQLVNALATDFPLHELSFAPVSGSLSTNDPGIGGFVYKDLCAEVGKHISCFFAQCYGDFSEAVFDAMVSNGYKPEQLIVGVLGGASPVKDTAGVVKSIAKKYSSFGGVFCWEYYDCTPSPHEWSQAMAEANVNTDEPTKTNDEEPTMCVMM